MGTTEMLEACFPTDEASGNVVTLNHVFAGDNKGK